ncbi:MAG: M13 family metallopeptidase [Patescibacteria group bacterium]|mgnify:CR=1 FL=1
MKKQRTGYWGFDTKSIDGSVRPQDDFYRYANGGWLKRAKMPAEESRWGSFTMLRYDTERQLKKLVAGATEPLVKHIHRSALDMATRNKRGIKPVVPILQKIDAVTSRAELQKLLEYLHVIGINAPWAEFVDQDSKDSSKYILHLWQGGLGMPERDYYLINKPEQKRVRDAYMAHIKRLSKLAGASTAEAEKVSRVVLAMETRLAKASMTKEDTRDPEKIYHKMSPARLQKHVPAVHWSAFFAGIGAKGVPSIIVGQPKFFKELGRMLKDTPLEDWKVYLRWHTLNGSESMLSEPFIKENFDFYARVLAGVKKMKPLWRRALAAVNGTVGDVVGRLYIKTHFPPAAKREMDILVGDLFAVYERRIKNLDWMSASTKRKAIRKLRAMHRKIAYPKKWKSYRGLVVKSDDYFGNMLRSSEHEHYRQMKKLKKPVDRDEWLMTPQTVNAYFSANMNEIVFPAAILQWPFFDPRADDAVNYAGIGSVIGHEMTHGFDDQGAKFDARGNMHNWWSARDKRNFEKKSKKLVAQADAYEVQPGVAMSGQLTLGENIADLGGLAIAYDAYQKHLHKTGRKTIAGLTPEERFFLGFAQMEREMARPEFVKMQALTDPHAHAPFRINGPLSNFEPFYRAFKLKKGDTLYRPVSSRAQIW